MIFFSLQSITAQEQNAESGMIHCIKATTCLGSMLKVAVGYFFSSMLEMVRLSPPCLIAATVS